MNLLPGPLALLGVVAVALSRGLFPVLALPLGALAGTLLLLAGAALMLLAFARFRARATTVDPRRPQSSSALVTDGIMGWSRNPMYLGMLLVLLGTGLALNPVGGVLAAAGFFWLMDRRQIPAEERALRQTFGATFDAYAARVRRWL